MSQTSHDGPVIDAAGLTKAYDGRAVVAGVSLSVAAGSVLVLLGPNGAGKTTTVEILEGFRRPDSGTVRVLGTDPHGAPRAWRARIGVVLQETRHDPYLTVGETLSLARGWYPRPLTVDEALTAVGLVELASRRVLRLSGGQQRRLDVALGLIGRPDVLFLDEPTTGLDPTARRQAWETVRGVRDSGTTVVLTTHYLDEAEALADRVLILTGGRVVADAPPQCVGGRDRTHTLSFRPHADDLADLPDGGFIDNGVWTRVAGDVTAAVRELTDWAARRGTALHGLTVNRPTLEEVYLGLVA
jgi:ABC-2 type transport system ATP-binding protein